MKLITCEYNWDTTCVELKFTDGSTISINCTAVEREVARNMYERSELDYLIFNDPLAYADTLSKMDENVFLGHGGAHVSYTDGHVEMISVKAGNTLEGRQEFWQNTYCGKKNLWYGRNK